MRADPPEMSQGLPAGRDGANIRRHIMLRTSLALILSLAFAGPALAMDDATSENDAIMLDENKEPYSPGAAQNPPPSTLPDPGEAEEMGESDVIDQ